MTQQPPPPQPQHPQQPHPTQQPGPPPWSPASQAAWSSAAPPSVRRRPNAPAIAALVVAGVMVLMGPAQQLAYQFGIGTSDVASYGAIGTIFSILGLVLALVTLALGVVGLVVRDRGRLLAAAAVGIGATSVVGAIISFGIGVLLAFA